MRLFLSLVPPRAVREQLTRRMHGLMAARWQDDSKLHATMRFIGAADRHQADALLLTLATERFAPIEAQLDGFGCFDRKGRVDQLWAGLTPRDPLAALHARLDRICVRCGFEPEGRRFVPHVTIARFARSTAPDAAGVAAWMASQPPLPRDRFTFGELLLMQSHMGNDGSLYEAIASFPMRG